MSSLCRKNEVECFSFLFSFFSWVPLCPIHPTHQIPRHHIISQYKKHQKITVDYRKSHHITSYHIIPYCASPHHTMIPPTPPIPSQKHKTQHNTHHILLDRCQVEETGEGRVTSSHLKAPPTFIYIVRIFL